MVKGSWFSKCLYVFSCILIGLYIIRVSVNKLPFLIPAPVPAFLIYLVYAGVAGILVAYIHNLTKWHFYGQPLTPADLIDGEYRLRSLGGDYNTFHIWEKNASAEHGARVITNSSAPFVFPLGMPKDTVASVTIETEKIWKSGGKKTTRRFVEAHWTDKGEPKITNQVFPY